MGVIVYVTAESAFELKRPHPNWPDWHKSMAAHHKERRDGALLYILITYDWL